MFSVVAVNHAAAAKAALNSLPEGAKCVWVMIEPTTFICAEGDHANI